MSFTSRLLSLALVAGTSLSSMSMAAPVTVLQEDFESYADGAVSIAIANTTATGAAGSGSRDTTVDFLDPDGGGPAPASKWLGFQLQASCPGGGNACVEPITLMLTGGKVFDEFRVDAAAITSTVSVSFHTQGGNWSSAIDLLTCNSPCFAHSVKMLAGGILADGVRFSGVENFFVIDNLELILNATIAPPGVPEPATVALVGLGLLGATWRRRTARPTR